MSMRHWPRERQDKLWGATGAVAKGPGHPFYAKLNAAMAEAGFDRFAEECCRKFYAETTRRSVAPGVYFRMLMVGSFEGIGSERGIA